MLKGEIKYSYQLLIQFILPFSATTFMSNTLDTDI